MFNKDYEKKIVKLDKKEKKGIIKKFKQNENIENYKSYFPKFEYTTDNAAMIAWAGIERYKKNLIDDVTFSARPRWPLDEKAPFLKGAGVDHS